MEGEDLIFDCGFCGGWHYLDPEQELEIQLDCGECATREYERKRMRLIREGRAVR